MKSWLCLVFVLLCSRSLRAEETKTYEALVKRGEYLANAADCVACHTPMSAPPFSGGRVLKTPFGTLVTPNITPDDKTGIGEWTSDDFYRALHWGIGRHGENLFPAFPYDSYTKMTRTDADAIYAYLRTIPPINHAVEVNQLPFPFNIRQSLTIWKALFFTPGEFAPNPQRSTAWNRGAYLVEALGHCGSCHTPRNFLGGSKLSEAYMGGPVEQWYAPNITSDLVVGIGEWRDDEIYDFLRWGIVRSKSSAVGPMAEVQETLSRLSEDDLRDMVTYLKSLPPRPDQDEATNEKILREEQDQRTLYLSNCGGCHHPLGLGRADKVPALVNNSSLKQNPSNILNVVLFGIAPRDHRGGMPAFASRLSDAEIAAVINYVRHRWGRALDQVTAADVTARRSAPP